MTETEVGYTYTGLYGVTQHKIVIFALENIMVPHTSRLMPFKETVAVDRENHTKYNIALCGPNAVALSN
jgi:hypothetical protein